MALSGRDLIAADLKVTNTNLVQYSKQHSKNLPPGSVTDFEWKDYCPKIFRLLQEVDNIEVGDYMRTVCTDETIKKVTVSSKPGQLFLLSNDTRFAVKTIRKSEVKVILEMLPAYYNHIKKYRNTLLNQMYGLHVLKPAGGVKVYFIVARNVLNSDSMIHRCYDLKGSLQGRKSGKTKVKDKTVRKESELEFVFYLEPLVRERLLSQIKHDCAFLEAVGIMNYSLLLGIHIKGSTQASVDRVCANNGLLHQSSLFSQSSSISSSTDSIDCRSTYSVNLHAGDSFQEKEVTELTFGDDWLRNNCSDTKFGEKMSVRGVRIPSGLGTGSLSSHQEYKSQDSQDLILYLGVVDFFQDYNVVKRIEHVYKSLHFDSKMIAAVNPKAYSARFQDFVSDIFKADDSL